MIPTRPAEHVQAPHDHPVPVQKALSRKGQHLRVVFGRVSALIEASSDRRDEHLQMQDQQVVGELGSPRPRRVPILFISRAKNDHFRDIIGHRAGETHAAVGEIAEAPLDLDPSFGSAQRDQPFALLVLGLLDQLYDVITSESKNTAIVIFNQSGIFTSEIDWPADSSHLLI